MPQLWAFDSFTSFGGCRIYGPPSCINCRHSFKSTLYFKKRTQQCSYKWQGFILNWGGEACTNLQVLNKTLIQSYTRLLYHINSIAWNIKLTTNFTRPYISNLLQDNQRVSLIQIQVDLVYELKYSLSCFGLGILHSLFLFSFTSFTPYVSGHSLYMDPLFICE